MQSPKNQPQRVPRPKGLTQALSIRPLTPTQKNHAIDKIIQEWIDNLYMYNGETYTLNQIAKTIGITIRKAYKRTNKVIRRLGVLKGTKEEDLLQEKILTDNLRSLILKEALGSRLIVKEQVESMLQSQAGEYQAFISSTVNQSIGNLLKSDQILIELLKAIKPTGPAGSIQINANQGPVVNGNVEAQYLTIDKAMSLIASNPDPFQPQALEAMDHQEFPQGHLPILATDQERVAEENVLLGTRKERPQAQNHEGRRADMLGIVEAELVDVSPDA